MTDQYFVVGNPIAHSKSPEIHSLFAQQLSQDLSYQRQLIDIDSFKNGIDRLIAQGVKGVNVTVPFKQEAWALAEHRSQAAELAGAVNTLSFNNGVIKGDNTDGVGLVRDLTVNHGQALDGKQVLILGAGGAVRGVLEAILNARPASVVIANRTLSKAVDLAAIFNCEIAVTALEYTQLDSAFDVVINGTSASLNNELPVISKSIFNSETVVYDMMYCADKTVFNQWAESCGVNLVFDGLGMLVEQAAESFTIWRDYKPQTAPVIARLRQAL